VTERKTAAAGALALAFLVLFALALRPAEILAPGSGPGLTDLGVSLWGDRAYEAILQSIVLLGGALAILLLLGVLGRREVAA